MTKRRKLAENNWYDCYDWLVNYNPNYTEKLPRYAKEKIKIF